MNGLRILVVGSEGYLGSRITSHLRSIGHQCDGIDAGFFSRGVLYGSPVETWKLSPAQDIEIADVEKYDAVIYLAAISNDPLLNVPKEKIYKPVLAHTLRVAEFCKTTGARFIFPSSCSVYGYSDEIVHEKSKLNPQTPYSENKVEVEVGLVALGDKDFRPIALRLATVYGPSERMRFDLVTNMLAGMAVTSNRVQLNSDGLAWRPHVHIEDVLMTFAEALEVNPEDEGLFVVNVGADENNMTVNDLATLVSNLSDAPIIRGLDADAPETIRDRKITSGKDSRSYRVSFERYRSLFPNSSKHRSLQAGVDDLIRFLKDINLNANTYSKTEFYRLQHLEKLVSNREIDERVFA